MTKKKLGAIVIVFVMCASFAVCFATSYENDVYVRNVKSYGTTTSVGSTTFVVTGTQVSAMTTGVNAYPRQMVLESSVMTYSYEAKDHVDDDIKRQVVNQGDALMVTVSRDYDNDDYRYEHGVANYYATSLGQATAATLRDHGRYWATQSSK